MNLTKNVMIEEVNAPLTASNSIDDNSDILDMSGWEGVVFITPITDIVSGGVATLKVEQNTANSNTGMAAVAGGSATVTSGGNDDENDTLLIVDVYKPLERYVQAVLTSATQDVAYGSTIAIRYGKRVGPITEASSVQASAMVVSPSEA
jgi:hypothetical protein